MPRKLSVTKPVLDDDFCLEVLKEALASFPAFGYSTALTWKSERGYYAPGTPGWAFWLDFDGNSL